MPAKFFWGVCWGGAAAAAAAAAAHVAHPTSVNGAFKILLHYLLPRESILSGNKTLMDVVCTLREKKTVKSSSGCLSLAVGLFWPILRVISRRLSSKKNNASKNASMFGVRTTSPKYACLWQNVYNKLSVCRWSAHTDTHVCRGELERP